MTNQITPITKELGLELVKALVGKFQEFQSTYKNTNYNETLTRIDFIDPLFKALGWDIANELNLAESYREVIHEDKVKVDKATKAPDYSFRLSGGNKLFFVEAKKPSIGIKDTIDPAYQVRRYGWSAKLAVSILTDFEEFAVYDCTKKPKSTDKSSNARLKYFTFDKYVEEWEYLWNHFSKEAVSSGQFENNFSKNVTKKGTETVDKEFLISLDEWRTLLAESISKDNKQLNEDELNFVVQQTLDRIIFLRICEDRNIEPYGKLKECLKGKECYKNLLSDFKQADEKYNSGLFDFKKDTLSHQISLKDSTLKTIINQLYYPDSPYEFSVLSVEILGSAYEQFLGKTISINEKGKAVIELKPEVRKAGGVYYTPQYIVDYIVKNTIGKLCENKTPKEVAELKIVDPACGSGSFLIGAYQYLLNWHKDYYFQHPNKKNPLTPEGNLTTEEKKKILLNNIYGVDIDVNAVEVTKLSLLLKCMEGETQASIQHQLSVFNERVLPTLDDNIKSGNSLIDTDYYDNQIDFGDERKIKPFNWQKAFPSVFKNGGFNVVIGNPPYVDYRLLSENEQIYLKNKLTSTKTKEKYSLYIPFIEIGTHLLNKFGLLGYIVPNTFLATKMGLNLREYLIKNVSIYEVTDVSKLKVFGNVGTYPVLFFYTNQLLNENIISLSYPKEIEDFRQLKFKTVAQVEIQKNVDYLISTSFNSSNMPLLDKLDLQSEELGSIVSNFVWGTSISGFKSYKINVSEYNDLNLEEKNKYSKVVQTADIKSFAINWQKEYILKSIYSKKSEQVFNQNPKIVIARLTKTIQATIDEDKYYVGKSSLFLPVKYHASFFLGLLNSKLINYYFKTKFDNTHMAGGYLRFDIPYLSKLPIKKLNLKDEIELDIYNQVIAQVNKLIQLKKDIEYVSLNSKKEQIIQNIEYCEDKINKLVYQLYDLTDEEIEMIENS